MWVEKHTGGYRIRDRNAAGKVVTVQSGFPTEKSANAIMKEHEADKLRGTFIDPKAGRKLLRVWIDEWWPRYKIALKPSTQISTAGIIDRYIRPPLGDRSLSEVDPDVVQQWVADLLDGGGKSGRKLSVKTVHNAHGLLYGILEAAEVKKLIRANPCKHTAMPDRTHHEMRFLTEVEMSRVVAHLDAHWQPIAIFLYATGARWGEAAGLRLRYLDLLAGRATIVRTLQELASTGEIVEVEPKTKAARRTVSWTPGDLLDVLSPLVVGKDRDALVFTAPRGGPARIRNFRRSWVAACKAADVGHVRIHDVRHSYAAWMISHGMQLTVLQRRMGHASIMVTSDLYGHLLPDVDDQVKAMTSTMLAPVLGSRRGADTPNPTHLNQTPHDQLRQAGGQPAA